MIGLDLTWKKIINVVTQSDFCHKTIDQNTTERGYGNSNPLSNRIIPNNSQQRITRPQAEWFLEPDCCSCFYPMIYGTRSLSVEKLHNTQHTPFPNDFHTGQGIKLFLCGFCLTARNKWNSSSKYWF